MKLLCWRQLLTLIFITSTIAGPVKIVQPYPRNVFELEGTPASVTCVAYGGPDMVQFVRRNDAGNFLKLNNESRVYTVVKADGGRTVFTLYFETLMISDDSADRRYECWAHQPGDKDDYWRGSAKHGFSINVISRTSLPTLLPKSPVVYKKNLGKSLRLECNITLSENTFDFMADSAHWTRNQKIIETVYAENGHFNRTLKPLTFNQISSKDGGNYTCLLMTRMREIRPLNFSGGIHVVLVKVKMTRTYQHIYTTEGKNVTLQCHAEGYPIRVSWKKIIGKSEVDLVNIPKLSTISKFYKDCETCNNKVKLHGVTKDLGGKYICRASNSLGGGEQIFILSVGEKVKIVHPYPRNVYIVEGDAATVTCIAEGFTDNVQFVRRNEFGKFGKLSNTSRFYTTTRIEGARTIFTLHLERSVLEDDSALRRYECWAHQPGDTSKHWHNSAKHGFSINIIARKFVPKISPEKGMIYKKRLGDSLILYCNMTVPKHTFDVRAEAVYWLRNKEILAKVYAEDGQFKRPLQPLSINNISARDGGNYSCSMETQLRGVKQLTIKGGTRTVFVEIEMQRQEQRLHAFRGQNVTLQCSAEGYPLHVEWKKVIGGLEIDVEKIPEISRNAQFYQDCSYCQHKLKLHNVTDVFSGTYRCKANNSVSSGEQKFTLFVTDAFTSSSLGITSSTSVFLLLLVLLENI